MTDHSNHMRGNSWLDHFIEKIGLAVRWFAVLLVLLQFVVVVARYLFDAGSVMAQEAILVLFGTMFMLAMADALASDRHVRVDMFYHSLPKRKKKVIDATGIVVFLLPLCLFMLWSSKNYILNSWASLEGSREADGLPGVFLFKTIIPISLILIIAQALAILARCIGLGGRRHG